MYQPERTVLVHCNNQAVVKAINSGKTRDPMLTVIGKNICKKLAEHDTRLQTRHIRGKKNIIADALSRLSSSPVHLQTNRTHLPRAQWLTSYITLLDINYQIYVQAKTSTSISCCQKPREFIRHSGKLPRGLTSQCSTYFLCICRHQPQTNHNSHLYGILRVCCIQ